MGAFLSAQQILDAADKKYAEVDVPAWGGKVRVQKMSAGDRDSLELANIDKDGNRRPMSNFRAAVCVRCIVDENGKRLFSDKDAAALGEKCSDALMKVYEAAAELNGLGVTEEEMAGNSVTTPGSDS